YGRESTNTVGYRAPDLPTQKSCSEQHGEHHCADRAADAKVATKSDDMALRHRHRNAAKHRSATHHYKHRIGWPSKHACFAGSGIRKSSREDLLGGSTKINRRQRDDHDNFRNRVPKHRLAPAVSCNDALEQRRPHGTRQITATGDQRQGRATPAVAPAADIDVHWRVYSSETNQADEQAVPEP